MPQLPFRRTTFQGKRDAGTPGWRRPRVGWRRRFARALSLMVALLGLPRPALAAPPITVGDGTAASCTQAALRDALTAAGSRGGGTVRFRCGRNRVTIALTATLTPSDNTTIDGGGLITLDGALAVRVVFVGRDTSVVLNNLGISNGTSAGSPELSGGGVYNAGALTVTNSTPATVAFLSATAAPSTMRARSPSRTTRSPATAAASRSAVPSPTEARSRSRAARSPATTPTSVAAASSTRARSPSMTARSLATAPRSAAAS